MRSLRSLGIIVFAIGLILRILKVVSVRISLDIILVGLILLLAGYILKKRAS